MILSCQIATKKGESYTKKKKKYREYCKTFYIMIFQPNNFKLLCVNRGTDPDFSSLLYSEPLFFFFGHNFEKKKITIF